MKTTLIALLILLPILAIAERPMNEMPMYGGQHDPSVERNPDFSKNAAKRGWKAYYQGDIATGIKRFNQAWMFDRENAEVYWGFGLVMGQRASQEEPKKNLEESIRFLKMAVDRDKKNGRILADLAFSYTLLGHYLETNEKNGKESFDKARVLFPAAFKLDSKYPPTVANWSVFYFYTQDYDAAKKKADEATKMGYQFNPEYSKDLEDKLK
jgi:tetratricopeptide (TPR) repeat protein